MNPKSEFDRINALKRAFASVRSPAELVGNGDDGAVLRVDGDLVVTTDALVEGVDFGAFAPWDAVGRKAIAVNASDLAAMGAAPLAFVWSVCAPRAFSDGAWEQLGAGAALAAQECALPCVGGDISRTEGPLALSVTALGTVPPGQALRRHGARPGHGIYLSGECGWAAAGLELLLPRTSRPDSLDALMSSLGDAQSRRAAWAQLAPCPHLAAGQALRGTASACVDVSDGLMQDLAHLLVLSGVGAALEADALPIASILQGRPDALAKALSGGEDFVLLFTAADAEAVARVSARLRQPLTRIGTVVAEQTLSLGPVTLPGDDVERLHRGQLPQHQGAAAWLGWRHF